MKMAFQSVPDENNVSTQRYISQFSKKKNIFTFNPNENSIEIPTNNNGNVLARFVISAYSRVYFSQLYPCVLCFKWKCELYVCVPEY